MTDVNNTAVAASHIEHVLEGYYLQPNGTRVWREHSFSRDPDYFKSLLPVDETGLKVHQPSEWRVVERDLSATYAVQGFYRRPGGTREWCDHTSRVDLAVAHQVYSWFHRMCQDPDYDSPTNARVINMGTGEVVPMEGFVAPEKQPGDAMRTIPVTPAEWEATLDYFSDWDSCLHRGKRRDGTFVWKSGRDYIVGYEDADGNIRIRPSAYKPARTTPVLEAA